MENVEWYYAADGRQMGPVTADALRQMLATRRVSPGDLVWCEGMKDWQPAATRAEFALPAPAAPDLRVVGAPAAPSAPLPPPMFNPGMPINALPYAPPVQDFQGMAIGAFVVSLVGIACFGVVLGPVAIVLASIAMNNMKRTGMNRGKGLAIAGLVIGIVDFALFFLFLAFRLAMLH